MFRNFVDKIINALHQPKEDTGEIDLILKIRLEKWKKSRRGHSQVQFVSADKNTPKQLTIWPE